MHTKNARADDRHPRGLGGEENATSGPAEIGRIIPQSRPWHNPHAPSTALRDDAAHQLVILPQSLVRRV